MLFFFFFSFFFFFFFTDVQRGASLRVTRKESKRRVSHLHIIKTTCSHNLDSSVRHRRLLPLPLIVLNTLYRAEEDDVLAFRMNKNVITRNRKFMKEKRNVPTRRWQTQTLNALEEVLFAKLQSASLTRSSLTVNRIQTTEKSAL